MRIDVEDYVEGLSTIESINLRNHIGYAYELAEMLEWCSPDEHFDIHKRTMSNKRSEKTTEAIVPIISNKFSTHEDARKAYTQLQSATDDIDIDVYDVEYDRQSMSIGIVLQPFEIG